ncbi:uncharacterized protein RBU33_019030 [Hipposideros larvatus]
MLSYLPEMSSTCRAGAWAQGCWDSGGENQHRIWAASEPEALVAKSSCKTKIGYLLTDFLCTMKVLGRNCANKAEIYTGYAVFAIQCKATEIIKRWRTHLSCWSATLSERSMAAAKELRSGSRAVLL